MKNNNLTKYIKMNIKSLIVLIYIKTIRLYSIDKLQIKYFNKGWIIGTSATLVSITLMNIFQNSITQKIIKVYDKKYTKAKEVLTVNLSIFYVLFFRFLYMRVFFGKNIINRKYIQIGMISILSVTFYILFIKPFFNNSHTSRFINSIINDTILLLSSDFIEDAKIDSNSVDIQISTVGTLFRIIINSLIKI